MGAPERLPETGGVLGVGPAKGVVRLKPNKENRPDRPPVPSGVSESADFSGLDCRKIVSGRTTAGLYTEYESSSDGKGLEEVERATATAAPLSTTDQSDNGAFRSRWGDWGGPNSRQVFQPGESQGSFSNL